MSDQPSIPEKLQPAFKIYLDELETHMEHLGTSIEGALKLSPSDPVRSQLAHRFHTIKGGAGFFQLTTLYEAAGRAEKILKGSISPNDDDELKQIYQKIKAQAAGLSALLVN